VTGSFAQSACNVTAAINPPIEVKDGDSVTITLEYSLANAISTGNSGDANCNGTTCFQIPTFVPAATKN
jgi:hypothetical protein